MNMPGFTAEASLCRTGGGYRMAGAYDQTAEGIRAAFVDQSCFNSCYNNCNWGCFGSTGKARSACLLDCKRTEIDCRNECTRSPLPPPPPLPQRCTTNADCPAGTTCTAVTTTFTTCWPWPFDFICAPAGSATEHFCL